MGITCPKCGTCFPALCNYETNLIIDKSNKLVEIDGDFTPINHKCLGCEVDFVTFPEISSNAMIGKYIENDEDGNLVIESCGEKRRLRRL